MKKIFLLIIAILFIAVPQVISDGDFEITEMEIKAYYGRPDDWPTYGDDDENFIVNLTGKQIETLISAGDILLSQGQINDRFYDEIVDAINSLVMQRSHQRKQVENQINYIYINETVENATSKIENVTSEIYNPDMNVNVTTEIVFEDSTIVDPIKTIWEGATNLSTTINDVAKSMDPNCIDIVPIMVFEDENGKVHEFYLNWTTVYTENTTTDDYIWEEANSWVEHVDEEITPNPLFWIPLKYYYLNRYNFALIPRPYVIHKTVTLNEFLVENYALEEPFTIAFFDQY